MNANKYSRFVYIIFLVFVFTIPVSTFISTRLLVLSLAFSLFVKTDGNFIQRTLRRSWEIYLYFVVLCIGIIYSDDMGLASRVIETTFSLAAMPLIVSRFDLDAKKIRLVIASFMAGVLVAGLICLINATLRYNATGDASVFIFSELTGVINSHPTYLAYYLIFSITIGFYWLYEKEKPFGQFQWLPVYIFFFVLLMLTGGHTAYISLLLIFSYFILKTITEKVTAGKFFLLVLIIVMLAAMFLVNSFEYSTGNEVLMNDYWERSPLWEAAIRANDNFFLGVGTGDYNTELTTYYKTHGLDQYADEHFNSHNQFIQLYLSNGLLGVIAIVLLFTRPVITSIKAQKSLSKLVFFPFIIYGMNEVLLGRYQGVVFFALIHQLLAAYNELTAPPIVGKAG